MDLGTTVHIVADSVPEAPQDDSLAVRLACYGMEKATGLLDVRPAHIQGANLSGMEDRKIPANVGGSAVYALKA